MPRRVLFILAALVLVRIGSGTPAPAAAQEVGPENGTLVIVGGALRDDAIRQEFLNLAGGPDARIVVIPTAGGGTDYDQLYPGLRAWRAAGASNLTAAIPRRTRS